MSQFQQNIDIGKSKAKKFEGEMMKIRFKDVAGCTEAKTEMTEFVDFLKNPAKYHVSIFIPWLTI